MSRSARDAVQHTDFGLLLAKMPAIMIAELGSYKHRLMPRFANLLILVFNRRPEEMSQPKRTDTDLAFTCQIHGISTTRHEASNFRLGMIDCTNRFSTLR